MGGGARALVMVIKPCALYLPEKIHCHLDYWEGKSV